MSPSLLEANVIGERITWIRQMLAHMAELPLDSYDDFTADPRNVAAAESYLRRALEALLDLGRHILAKGFGQAVVEYRGIARALAHVGVLTAGTSALLLALAGYRNRLVHFYNEITAQELYEICSSQLGDVETVVAGILDWIKTHPDLIDRSV